MTATPEATSPEANLVANVPPWAMTCDPQECLSLMLPVKKLSAPEIQQLSPIALAYLGDAVYELFIRAWYLRPPKRQKIYHNCVVSQVRAETQAQMLRSLEPFLTPNELEILKRGRNAATGGPKRVDAAIYQQATSLESLMGYLYLTDPNRLIFLFTQLNLELLERGGSTEL
ncbi:Mini-ribonuclease 3 [Laspinema olomoucense]|uniref:Mini-ribonuclease 3 n=1 Tax=Laspinema olomoucense TaxID=3231600 RepID=UPI0021BB270F|nr:ribonuclease III domain-containing protein [Laspinema sp. D3a]MCT7988637.1 ribonuclease III [Laspinema sp. D3a]